MTALPGHGECWKCRAGNCAIVDNRPRNLSIVQVKHIHFWTCLLASLLMESKHINIVHMPLLLYERDELFIMSPLRPTAGQRLSHFPFYILSCVKVDQFTRNLTRSYYRLVRGFGLHATRGQLGPVVTRHAANMTTPIWAWQLYNLFYCLLNTL